MHYGKFVALVVLSLSSIFVLPTKAETQTPGNVFKATLDESGQKTKEISTEELKAIVAIGSAVVLDTRPHKEFTISHIPGSVNVAPKPGTTISQYVSDVAEVERLVNGRKNSPIVLYCNGPFCGKSKRLAQELLDAGFTNIRRYQLGIPVWRSLGGVTEIEPEGIRYVYENDKTAVLIDARDSADFKLGPIQRSKNIPR